MATRDVDQSVLDWHADMQRWRVAMNDFESTQSMYAYNSDL